MSGGYYIDVRRDAVAKLFTAVEFEPPHEQDFSSAEDAFAAAIAARDSGKFRLIRVWVDGAGSSIEFPLIEDLYQSWVANPEG